jgi:hypothetical protein
LCRDAGADPYRPYTDHRGDHQRFSDPRSDAIGNGLAEYVSADEPVRANGPGPTDGPERADGSKRADKSVRTNGPERANSSVAACESA